MRKYLFIIAAFLIFAPFSFAQNVLTEKDFDFGWIRKSSGQETTILKIEINPKLSPVTLWLVPDGRASTPTYTGSRQQVGKILVFSGDSLTVTEEIKVETFIDNKAFIEAFTMKDINFDGYLDIAVLDEFGAKWGRYNWWLYDPKSGSFITSPLTDELGKLSGANIEVDKRAKQVKVESYYGVCPQSEIYKIIQGHFIKTEFTERTCEMNGTEVRLWKLIDGKMKLVRTWKE